MKMTEGTWIAELYVLMINPQHVSTPSLENPSSSSHWIPSINFEASNKLSYFVGQGVTTDKFTRAETGAPSRYFWKYLVSLSINLAIHSLHEKSSYIIGQLVTHYELWSRHHWYEIVFVYQSISVALIYIGFEILHLHIWTNSDKYWVRVRT